MTTREIAEAAGLSIDTIQRIGRELYPAKFGQGKRTDFNKQESIEIMKRARKLNFVELPQNAEVLPQNAEVDSSLTSKDIELIARVVSMTVAETIKQLDVRMTKIEGRIEQRQALLPAPPIEPREHINMIVRDYSAKNSIEFRDVWKELYKQFSYRTNSNPSISAKNRGMTIIDYIESEGMIETLESIAMDCLK